MATIKGLLRRVKSMKVDAVVERTIEAKKDELLTANKKQLFEGFDKRGGRLPKYRRAKYARIKNEMNPIPGLGNPDYFVTGRFYRGWSVVVNRDEIKNQFNDSKSDWLLKRSPGIAGLGGDYKSDFINEHLRSAFLSEVRKTIGL